jgi:hypothetical protein
MGDLKDFAIAAHGGLDRWNQLSEVRAHLLFGGVAWALKKQDGVINDSMVLVELHRQFASYYAFGKDGLRTSFTADRVAIETTAGQVSGGAVGPEGGVRRSCPGHAVGPAPPCLLFGLRSLELPDDSVLIRAAGVNVGGVGALAGERPDLASAQGEVPRAHCNALRGTGVLLRRGRPTAPPRLHRRGRRPWGGRSLHFGVPRVRRGHGPHTAAGPSSRCKGERSERSVPGDNRA